MKQLRQFIAVVINDHVHVLRSSPCLWYMQRKSDSARLGSQVFKIVTSPFEPLWKLSKPLHCISTTHVIVFVRARARACESNQILSRESESVGPPAAPAGHQGAPLTVPPAKIRFSKKGRRVRVTLLVGGERPSAWWLVPCGPPWRLLAVTVLGTPPPRPPAPSPPPGKMHPCEKGRGV